MSESKKHESRSSKKEHKSSLIYWNPEIATDEKGEELDQVFHFQ